MCTAVSIIILVLINHRSRETLIWVSLILSSSYTQPPPPPDPLPFLACLLDLLNVSVGKVFKFCDIDYAVKAERQREWHRERETQPFYRHDKFKRYIYIYWGGKKSINNILFFLLHDFASRRALKKFKNYHNQMQLNRNVNNLNVKIKFTLMSYIPTTTTTLGQKFRWLFFKLY